jgi:hypothetical protein
MNDTTHLLASAASRFIEAFDERDTELREMRLASAYSRAKDALDRYMEQMEGRTTGVSGGKSE